MAAANGNTVRVHYTGSLNDGTVFDTSRGGEPIEFAVGGRMVIAGFENAVLGMEPGDSKKLTIPAGEAYGEHDPRLVQDVPRSELPQGLEPQPGMQLTASGNDGREIALVITEVTERRQEPGRGSGSGARCSGPTRIEISGAKSVGPAASGRDSGRPCGAAAPAAGAVPD